MHPKDAKNASADDILREILDVVTALHNGQFTAHVTDGLPGLGGEIAAVLNAHLKMLGDLRREHHRLMEEIGVTGRLGGQMEVDGLNGAWKEMFDDTNRMGGHMTAQYRDGWNVARALLRGDLAARMSCQCIQGEFREFRERFNELAERFEQASGAAMPEPAGV
jgi:hypothetical protein